MRIMRRGTIRKWLAAGDESNRFQLKKSDTICKTEHARENEISTMKKQIFKSPISLYSLSSILIAAVTPILLVDNRCQAAPAASIKTSATAANSQSTNTPAVSTTNWTKSELLKAAQIAELEGQNGLADEKYSAALKAAQSASPADSNLILACTAAFADFLEKQSRFPEELSLRQNALALAEKAYGKASPQYAGQLANLACYHASKGEGANARNLTDQANAILIKNPDSEKKFPLENSASYFAIARRQIAEGTLGLADDSYIKARELQESKLGKDNLSVLISVREHANLLQKIDGRKAEVDKLQDRITLAIALATTGSGTTGSTTPIKAGKSVFGKLVEAAKLASKSEDHSKAIIAWKLAVDDAEKRSAGNISKANKLADSQAAYAMVHLADQYRGNKQPDEAITVYKRAIEKREKLAATETLGMARNLDRLGQCYMQAMKSQEAQPYLSKAFEIEEKIGADDAIKSATMQMMLSMYLSARNNSKAEAVAKQLLAMPNVTSGNAAVRKNTALGALGSIYMQTGRMNEGMELLKQVSTTMTAQTGADTTRAYKEEYERYEKIVDEAEEKGLAL